MSAALNHDPKNLRAWLHRIEEECASADATPQIREIRDAALSALCGAAAPGGPGLTITAAAPEDLILPSDLVRINLSTDEAAGLSSGLADIACWIRGWMAGASEAQRDNAPLGLEAVRTLNLQLKAAMRRAEENS
ncbi:hypothetical protein [Ancylobacter polymorphus]|uniref:PH domain-containing protein n=1 Tax=Ancylobacter polymorphus TaxID=223390 RepID=A0ABU0B6G1_9HYPH|nr:hypothetical protein [Ancylobacter polymorphus]MDQ0301411.1 hypothetical protein [Ancylobacter polymorphus]